MKFISPLTNKECTEIVQKLSVKDIDSLYKKKMKFSVKDEFEEDYIYLVREASTDFEFFSPFRAGSKKFYQNFYSNDQYNKTKEEYHFAANYISQNDSVLDIGCGEGNFAKHLKTTNFTGLDMTPLSVKKAKDKGITAYNLTIEQYLEKFEAKKFSRVVSFQVLEHVEDPLGFIKNCLLPLNQDGLLILSVPNNDGYKYLEVNSVTNIPPHHISRWSLKTFIHVAQILQLEIVDYNYDTDTLKNHLRFGILQKIIRRNGRSRVIIKWNLTTRIINLVLNVFFHAFKPILNVTSPSVSGHSLTVVLRRKS